MKTFEFVLPSGKECDALIRVLSFILRKCVINKNVPVKSQCSVYSFALPSSTHSMSSAAEKTGSTEEGDEGEDELIGSSDDEEGLFACCLFVY